jgi:hypothetical protein
MTAGKPNTEYRVTLCKKEAGGLPVITPFTIYRKQYEQILKIIYQVQGEKQR